MLCLKIGLSLSLGLSILLELFMTYNPRTDCPPNGFRQAVNILLLVTTLVFMAAFGVLAWKGAGCADRLSRVFWTEIIGSIGGVQK